MSFVLMSAVLKSQNRHSIINFVQKGKILIWIIKGNNKVAYYIFTEESERKEGRMVEKGEGIIIQAMHATRPTKASTLY
jgi:hypothetical protein